MHPSFAVDTIEIRKAMEQLDYCEENIITVLTRANKRKAVLTKRI